MYIKISLTILGMILGIAATGLVTALSMSETVLAQAQGIGGGCGVGGCGGSEVSSGSGTDASGAGGGRLGNNFGTGAGYGDTGISGFSRCGQGGVTILDESSVEQHGGGSCP